MTNYLIRRSITTVALQVSGLFGGAVLTETVFAYPGMGRLYFQAIGQSDWPIVMGYLLILAILVVISDLTADIAYVLVDPRIRYDFTLQAWAQTHFDTQTSHN